MAFRIDDTAFNFCVNKLLELIPLQPEQAGLTTVSFKNGFFMKTEGYKFNVVLRNAKHALNSNTWNIEDVGTGKVIYPCIMAALKKSQNLKSYYTADFEEKSLLNLQEVEKLFFDLYRDDKDEEVFNSLIRIYGRKYDLMAYLMFIKNSETKIHYLPCRNTEFKARFSKMGIKTNCVDESACSWENYQEFLAIMEEVRKRIQPKFESPINLLNAHSFVWAMHLLENSNVKVPTSFSDFIEGQPASLISKNEWESILRDTGVTYVENKEYLISLYKHPSKAACCKELGDEGDVQPSSFITPVVAFVKRILAKLNLDIPKRSNGDNIFWAVLFFGRENRSGLFEWKIRPNLAEAMETVWDKDVLETRLINDEKEAKGKSRAELFTEISRNPYTHHEPSLSQSLQHVRDPRLKALARKRADGWCILCGNNAPFKDKDGEPYLETHHIIWLANGGTDTADNVVALCPNCHKKMHILALSKDVKELQRSVKEYLEEEQE